MTTRFRTFEVQVPDDQEDLASAAPWECGTASAATACRTLSKDQRKLMEELAKTLPVPELNPKDKSFIDKMKDILS